MKMEETTEDEMSLWDFFAAQAMVGLLMKSTWVNNVPAYSYDIADEMMRERAKRIDSIGDHNE
jgi:hypothetical protein